MLWRRRPGHQLRAHKADVLSKDVNLVGKCARHLHGNDSFLDFI